MFSVLQLPQNFSVHQVLNLEPSYFWVNKHRILEDVYKQVQITCQVSLESLKSFRNKIRFCEAPLSKTSNNGTSVVHIT